jgi:hypothetical protein
VTGFSSWRTTPRRRTVAVGSLVLGPAAALGVAWATSSVSDLQHDGLAMANVALLLALVTVSIALVSWPGGVLTSVASALSLNWFHTEPLHTFRIEATSDVIAVLLLGLLGVGVSLVTARRVRVATRVGSSIAARRARGDLLDLAPSARPAHELWQVALGATSAELALVEARVITARAVDLPIISRHAWTDDAEASTFVLPPSGAAIPLGTRSNRFLLLTPRREMTSLVLDRRVVTSFADSVRLALESEEPASLQR